MRKLTWGPQIAGSFLVLAITVTLAACGADGGGPAAECEFDCMNAPGSVCVDGTRVSFVTPGTCESGLCTFERTEELCANGCTDGVCNVIAECNAADCTEPPDNRCDGDTVLRYDAGACVDNECVYPATTEDCTTSGDICRDAECVPLDPGLCAEVTCDAPPADRCDGDTRVSAGAGTCDAATGVCNYEETLVDCAADGGFCRGGRCLEGDPCTGITCTAPPSPTCDGDVPVTYVASGTCVADETATDGYRCSHAEQRGAACRDGCADGACIDPACEIECVRPPASSCTSAGVARRYADVGVCVDGGRCTYALTEEDCTEAGLRCDPVTFACVADPCADVDCSTPPEATCDGNVVVESTGSGTCTAGTCAWPVRFTDCGSLFCDDGECVTRNPCSGITCGEPAPGPTCDGNVAVTAFDNSYCLSGECRWDEERVNCAEGGGVCVAGACVFDGRCPGGCDEPPADTCLGAIARDYPSEGVCNVSNVCDYSPVDTNCRDLGLGCAAGRCIDVCAVITCDNPPPDRCDGGEAVAYAAEGECAAGVCAYEVTRTRCADLGLACDAGACVSFDFCPTIICETPPQNVCDGSTAVQYSRDGTCNEATDLCEYAANRVNCAATGRFCFNGACQDNDPCAGISCNTAPPDTCSADFAVRSTLPGECIEGLCEFETTEYWCGLENAACLRGDCVGGEFCDALNCDAEPGPTPYCDRDVRVTFDPRCRVGLCLWDIVRTNCRDAGDYCYEGECIDVDPCTFTACSEPPADECDGDLLYRYDPAGTCEFASCSYDVDVINCADSDSFCAAGACRPNDNPCRGVVCDAPGRVCADNDAIVQKQPGVCELGICLYADDERIDCDVAPAPRCEGRTAITWADDGSCVDGECVFTETRVDCAASGRFCDEGICALENPCAGVTCGGAPAPSCDGDRVVTRAAGACDSGVCRNDIVSVVDCTQSDRVCVAGACVADPACGGVSCSAPPEDYCVDTFQFRYAPTGDCSRGECNYSAIRFDCRGLGRVCIDGECVPPAPCDGVDCSGAPPAPVCDGDVAVVYTGTGDCALGACVYLSTRTDCGNVRGGSCEAGACANVCDGVVCADAPEPTCAAGVAVEYRSTGICDAELGCVYPIATATACADDGLICRDGACVDPCAGVVCDSPPGPICLGGQIATWAPTGTCSAGSCLYELNEAESCGELTCIDGECVPFDPCDLLTCPAGNFCRGQDVVRAISPGTCISSGPSAFCDYGTLTTVEECDATEGGVCIFGECVNGCEGVVCDDQAPFCVGQLAVVATAAGTCVNDGGRRCEYDEFDVVADCTELPDSACLGGFCTNVCAPVTCGEGQAYCDGDEVRLSTAGGTCRVVGGAPSCEFDAGDLVVDCATTGTSCVDGACTAPPVEGRIREVAPVLAGGFAGHSMLEVQFLGGFGADSRIEIFDLAAPTSRFSVVRPASDVMVFTSAPAALLPGTQLEDAVSWAGSAFIWPAVGGTVVMLVDGAEIGRITILRTFPWSTGVSMELSDLRAGDLASLTDPAAWCAAPRETDASGNRFTPGRAEARCDRLRFSEVVSQLQISELYFGDGGATEWFEVLNPAGAPLDLGGVTITNDGGDITTLPTGTFTPRARGLVFARRGAAGGVAADILYDVSVSATAGTLSLLSGASVMVLDFGASAGIPIFAGSSTQIDAVNVDRAWCRSQTVYAAGRFGTPGSQNHSCIGEFPCVNAATDCPTPRTACSADGRFAYTFVAPPVCGSRGCSYGAGEREVCGDARTCNDGVCE